MARCVVKKSEVGLIHIPLSDEDWIRVSHLFSSVQTVYFGKHSRKPRELLDAIVWALQNDKNWAGLPKAYPPPRTCYMKYLQWKRTSILDEVLKILDAPATD